MSKIFEDALQGLLEAIEMEKGNISIVERENMPAPTYYVTDAETELIYGKVIDLEQYTNDSRLTEPSDGKIFDYRKMLTLVKQIGRPLTEQEAESFRIK